MSIKLAVTKLMFPNAVNSLDRFHLIQEFNRRLERIRIDAMNRVKPNPNFKETNHSLLKLRNTGKWKNSIMY